MLPIWLCIRTILGAPQYAAPTELIAI